MNLVIYMPNFEHSYDKILIFVNKSYNESHLCECSEILLVTEGIFYVFQGKKIHTF